MVAGNTHLLSKSSKRFQNFLKLSFVRPEIHFGNRSNGIFNRVVPQAFLTGVTHAHRVASEEIFGPVLSVMTFRTPEEAFERANNIPYGLSAGVWTDKKFSTPHPGPLPVRGGEGEEFKMVNKLRAGVVWANTYNKFDPTSPFGGYKESGFGREGGLQGLAAYGRVD